MRSNEEIEQELEFYREALKRREKNIETNKFLQETPDYKSKIELLQWVLGGDEE